MTQARYVVAYMAGRESEGVTDSWTPVASMAEAVRFIAELEVHHDFYKASICEIKETHEN
mgnify:FL=1|tara:strand:+ start:550 stop:729 length:180 start_codon:yes stop_codon:yes gene_type:complete